MPLTSEYDSLIEQIDMLQGLESIPGNEGIFDDLLAMHGFEYLADPSTDTSATPANLPNNAGQPFPNFELPGDIIPHEFNIPLSPIAWVLCDNGIGQLLDIIGAIVKGFIGGILLILGAIVLIIKFIVDLVTSGFGLLMDLLKNIVQALKDFYCASQHIRFSISKIAPVLAPVAGLDPYDPKKDKPKVPSIYPDQAGTTDPTYNETFDALVSFKSSNSNRIQSALAQVQGDQLGTYQKLREKIVGMIPITASTSTTDMTDAEVAAVLAKAQTDKYFQGLQDSINSILSQIGTLKITKTGTGSGSGTGATGAGGTTGDTGAGTGAGGTTAGTGASVDGGQGTGPGGSDGSTVTESTGTGPGGSSGVTVTQSTGVGGSKVPYYAPFLSDDIFMGITSNSSASTGNISTSGNPKIPDQPKMIPFDTTADAKIITADASGATQKNITDLMGLIDDQTGSQLTNIKNLDTNNKLLTDNLNDILNILKDGLAQQRIQDKADWDAAALKAKADAARLADPGNSITAGTLIKQVGGTAFYR